MDDDKIRLNPFVYISETDIAFYSIVLIGIIIPILFTLIFAESYLRSKDQLITSAFKVLLVIMMFSFMPLLIYWIYAKTPTKLIKNYSLKEFNRTKFHEYYGFLQELYEKYLPGAEPILLYNIYPSESAVTFGRKNHIYIGLDGGLIKKFRNSIDEFRVIILHEIGHIVNGDVEKTFIAVSTWTILYTFSYIFGIIMIFILLIIFISGESLTFENLTLTFGIIIYFLLFLLMVYVLRNKIIRIREFYADARVLEWDGSSEKIIETLQECREKQFSKIEILNRFHPNVYERIQILRNNENLFIPSLWVAFCIGSSSFLIEFSLVHFSPESSAVLKVIMYIAVYPLLMLFIGSIFHKQLLKDIFISGKKYFSLTTAFSVTKFSLVFSLGLVSQNILFSIPTFKSINGLLSDILYNFYILFVASLSFSIILLYLLIFSSLLIRRSFNKHDAYRNFLFISILSSVIIIINRLYTKDSFLLIIVFLILSLFTYVFIRIKYKNSLCPSCSRKIDFSNIRLNCPNCNQELYPWAVYSFSKSSEEGESISSLKRFV